MKRGYDHNKVQKLGRKRDAETCQICGNKDDVQGHHVFDYQYGGKADVDNIISLCHDCHTKVHHGLLDIFVF